ncbi:ferritin family protein [Clostridium massiliodielmoense]|uniref:ferritin family protein n=1 Tax=Clostridium massiliodielmoense TaxID=1776385 RepID=UPI0004D6C49E|nr:ferritin family protein [Clostridium massiliodielmoense]KEH97075.1 rubrerythrin [Clostridium botulinum C/D str. BKT12695]
MSYTTNKQPQGYPYFVTSKLREDMIGELVAINDYSFIISNCSIKEINDVLSHIRQEEHNHYGMLLKLLRKHDPMEMDAYLKVISHTDLTPAKEYLTVTTGVTDKLLLNYLREGIKGELEAVILYEQHLAEIPYTDIRETLQKIVYEEKEHLEELTLVLTNYDKGKYGPIEK